MKLDKPTKEEILKAKGMSPEDEEEAANMGSPKDN